MVLRATPPLTINLVVGEGETYEFVEDETLPKEPVAAMVIDNKGKPKWTVSIPPELSFPLRPTEYAAICHQSASLAESLQESQGLNGLHQRRGFHNYYHTDPHFMDIAEAEEQGLLSANRKVDMISHQKMHKSEEKHLNQISANLPQTERKICERSLTYVLESADAGLGTTLLGLWMSYGLAKKEGRAFFISDTNWYSIILSLHTLPVLIPYRAYGKYTTFFKPPPLPSCLPPLSTHLLPCPHQARHLVVSASTAPWTFGKAFAETLQDTRKPEPLRQKPLFSLLRMGHDALFHLSDADAGYLAARNLELNTQIRAQGGVAIGLHVRRGDRHPWEFQYQKSYIPIEAYVDAAQAMLTSVITPQPPSANALAASKFVLASDDPDIYDAPGLQSALHAQSQIILASKSTLDAAQGSSGTAPSSSPSKFVEGNVGWEGGFFSNVFWGLGLGNTVARGTSAAREDGRERPPSEISLRLRELVARAYLLDLKVLGGADGVVCGVSSAGCRLLGVMMGWDGVVSGRWKNIDGAGGWVAFGP